MALGHRARRLKPYKMNGLLFQEKNWEGQQEQQRVFGGIIAQKQGKKGAVIENVVYLTDIDRITILVCLEQEDIGNGYK